MISHYILVNNGIKASNKHIKRLNCSESRNCAFKITTKDSKELNFQIHFEFDRNIIRSYMSQHDENEKAELKMLLRGTSIISQVWNEKKRTFSSSWDSFLKLFPLFLSFFWLKCECFRRQQQKKEERKEEKGRETASHRMNVKWMALHFLKLAGCLLAYSCCS